MRRLTPALLLLAASAALAQQPAAQPATPPPAAPGAPATLPTQPPKPPPIPVPDGPAVSTQQLDGGLIVEDIKIGDGYQVKEGGAVVALYHGTLKADPTKVFDSAFNRGEPLAFPLSGVIAGWQKGVPGMKIGGVRRLTVPAALAYGAQSPSPEIPANSDLVFVIQLVDALQTEDVKAGDGDEAGGTFVAVTAYSIKDKDGKEIEKADAAHPYIWIPNECQGISAGLEGMKVGGKRKIHVPKELNKWNPQFAAGHTADVPIDVEIDLVALRNLGPKRR